MAARRALTSKRLSSYATRASTSAPSPASCAQSSSTVSVDTALLFGDGEARRAWLNVAGTAVVCVAAAAVGIGLGALVM